MKLSILTGAMLLGSLLVAGNAFALVEAVGEVGHLAQGTVDSGMQSVAHTSADAHVKAAALEESGAAIGQTGAAIVNMQVSAAVQAIDAFPADCLLHPEVSTGSFLAKQMCLFMWTNTIVEA